MRESEAEYFVKQFTASKNQVRHGRLFAVIITMAIAGAAILDIVTGWYLHNTYWRKSELDYSLQRAVTILAACKDVPYATLIRQIEIHIARPHPAFQLDDKLIALDYVFDRMEARHCGQPRAGGERQASRTY